MRMSNRLISRHPSGGVLVVLALTLFAVPSIGVFAEGPKQKKGVPARNLPIAPPPPRSALLTHEAWQRAPLTPLQPGEIDGLVAKELRNDKVEPAALTTDEQFIRRVTLDLTGHLPEPADVEEFVADSHSNKRSRLIDRLLASDQYA